MPATLKHHEEEKTLKVCIFGCLEEEDFARIAPLTDELAERHRTLDLLVILHSFRGWAEGASWEDIQFEGENFDDVARIAVVGDEAREKGVARFCAPFTSADVEFFDSEQLSAAQKWLGVSDLAGDPS